MGVRALEDIGSNPIWQYRRVYPGCSMVLEHCSESVNSVISLTVEFFNVFFIINYYINNVNKMALWRNW